MSFDLPTLIWIEVEEIVYSISPLSVIGITSKYFIAPLCYSYFLCLLGIGDLIVRLCIIISMMSTNFFDYDFVGFPEVRVTHNLLQNLALEIVRNELRVEAALHVNNDLIDTELDLVDSGLRA